MWRRAGPRPGSTGAASLRVPQPDIDGPAHHGTRAVGALQSRGGCHGAAYDQIAIRRWVDAGARSGSCESYGVGVAGEKTHMDVDGQQARS